MTEIFENWEAISHDTEKELKTMRRKLHRRNWSIILTSVILVVALIFSTVKLIIPALEKRYWDPSQCTYLEDVTDLELMMYVYSELFGHGQHLLAVETEKEGFASYSINAVFANWNSIRSLTKISFGTASMDKGEISSPLNFWNNIEHGGFIETDPVETEYIKKHNDHAIKYLRQLPEYVDVFASVTFSEDLTMHELLLLSAQYREGAEFTWAVLRDGETHDKQCGVHLSAGYDHQYSPDSWTDAGYPNLFVERQGWNERQMENHITSMLKFSDDQLKKDQGILADGEDPDYYAKTLKYIEQNGIEVYGSHVFATPQTLIDMMEDGVISYINITDARIGLTLK